MAPLMLHVYRSTVSDDEISQPRVSSSAGPLHILLLLLLFSDLKSSAANFEFAAVSRTSTTMEEEEEFSLSLARSLGAPRTNNRSLVERRRWRRRQQERRQQWESRSVARCSPFTLLVSYCRKIFPLSNYILLRPTELRTDGRGEES